MDMEILVTILLCVVAAVFTLVSLFFFAKKRQKSYEEVKQDEINADLALSKELSSTPRSKPAVKQYKPWMSRKKKSDEATTDASAHVTPDAAHVIPSEPIQATDEIADLPVVKAPKKKRPQQSPVAVAQVTSSVIMETPIEITPAVTLEAVPVEESTAKTSTNKQKKPNKSSVEQPTKHKQKKTGRKDGDTVSFNDLSSLVESSPLGDDQIQELVDMLLTRKDGGWQSANKGDDSLASWKKRFSEVKEQWEDVQKEKSNLTATVKRQREELTQHQTELRQHKMSSQQKMQQLSKEITQLKTRLQAQEEEVSTARTTRKNHQQLQEENGALKHQLTALREKERQANMEIVTLQQSALKSNGANGDHDALSRVKELEESLAAQDRHYNSESVRLKEVINRLEVDRKQYEDSVHQLETSNVHKDQQLKEALGRLADVQQELDSYKDRVANTEAQVRSSNNELQEQVDKLTADSEANLLHHQEEVEQLNERLKEMTSQCDREKQASQQHKDELVTVTEQLQLKDQQLTGLQQQLQQKEEGLTEVDQQLLKSDEKFTEFQQQLQQKGEELTKMHQQLQQKEEGLSELQLQLQQKNNECVQLTQQLTTAQEELTRLQDNNSAQNVDSVLLTVHNDLLQKKEVELVKVIEENKQLRENSKDLEKQIDSLEERIDQLLDQTVKQKEENQQIKDEAERSLKEQLTSAEKSSREHGSRQVISECKSFLLNLFPSVIVSDSKDFSSWKEAFKAQITTNVFSKLNELETVQAQLADKELQEAHFAEERQKLMETLEATKGMLETLQDELESHDTELQQKLHEAESKLEQEKIANRTLSRQLQSEQDKSNSLTKQLEVVTEDKVNVTNKLEDEMKNKQSMEMTLQEQLTRSHEDIKSLREQLQEITIQKDDCVKKNEELESECKKLTEQSAAKTTPTHRPVNESSV